MSVRAGERGLESPSPGGRAAGRAVLRPETGDAPCRAMRFSYIAHTGVLI